LILAFGTVLAGLGFILLGWAGGIAGLAAFLCVAGAGIVPLWNQSANRPMSPCSLNHPLKYCAL